MNAQRIINQENSFKVQDVSGWKEEKKKHIVSLGRRMLEYERRVKRTSFLICKIIFSSTSTSQGKKIKIKIIIPLFSIV